MIDEESGTASLHAGLIQRARPRVTLAPGVVPLHPPASEPGRSQGLSGAVSTPTRQFDLPVHEPASLDLRPVREAIVPELEEAEEVEESHEQRRRFALTLRVEPDLHRKLMMLRRETACTTQSILHAALCHYLAED